MKKFLLGSIILFITCSDLISQLNNQVLRTSSCGLNFIHVASKITTRYATPAGSGLPVQLTVSGLPTSCVVIEHAYIWWIVSWRTGSPISPTVTVTNPSGNVASYSTILTGTGGSKCWGEQGTRGFRADVRNSINGNGTYTINVNTDVWETDGLTLLIVYRDLNANYQGHFVIYDGLITSGSGTLNATIPNINACAASSNARGFLIASDIQDNVSATRTFTLNGTTLNLPSRFWNSEVVSTNVTFNQPSSGFTIQGGADCYSWIMMGLYYQTTTCAVCPTQLNINTTANPNTICAGDNVQLNATGGFLYNWTSNPPGFTSNQQNPIVNPTVTTDYYVHSTSIDGCVHGYDTIRVIVRPLPVADAGNNINVCSGQAVTIGNPATGGTAPYTYSWTPPNGLSATNIAQPSASPTVQTTYIVTVTDANGCIDRDTVVVGVYQNPIADAGNDKTICSGTSTQIGHLATGGSPPYSYQWSPPVGLSSPTVAQPTATVINQTTYIVTVTDANGCIDRDTIVISTYPLPVPDAGNDTEICFGSSTQIGGTASGGTPPYTYQWSPSAGLSSATIASPVASPSSTTNYTVAVTDANGCVNYDSVLVTVNPLPIADAGPDRVICFGDTTTIGVPGTNGTPPYTYSWSPPTGLNATNQATVSAWPTQTTVYVVEITDSKGCVDMDTVEVRVNPLPQPVIIPSGPTRFCTCDSIMLSSDRDYASYLWSTGATSKSIIVRTSGTYLLTVVDENGCENTSLPIEIEVVAPQATINISSQPARALDGEIVRVPIYISNAQDLDFCKSFNFTARISLMRSILVPQGTTPKGSIDVGTRTRTITINGTRKQNDSVLFIMEYISTLGEDSSTAINIASFDWTDCDFDVQTNNTTFTLDGICSAGGKARLLRPEISSIIVSLRPHPTNNKATLDYFVSEESNVRLFIVDFSGKNVSLVYEGVAQKGMNNIEFNVHHLTTGIYFLVLDTKNHRISKLMEIEK